MEQNFGIKIEGPTEEKISIFFVICAFLACIFVFLTMGLLLVEFLNIETPIAKIFNISLS